MYFTSDYQRGGRLSESHCLLLFDVFWSDGMWQRDNWLLLCVSGQSFPHICKKREKEKKPQYQLLQICLNSALFRLCLIEPNSRFHSKFNLLDHKEKKAAERLFQKPPEIAWWWNVIKGLGCGFSHSNSSHRRRPRPVRHCSPSNILSPSCTRCSPDACTCSPPLGWRLAQRDPQRIRPSCRTTQH